jgi:hypothetical protein
MKKIIVGMVLGLLLSASAMAQAIPAYLIGIPASLGEVESKLKANGFEVLANTNGVLTVTNGELKSTNTYVATIQVYVGLTEVRVQNPDYFGLAYLGDKYKKGQFSKTLNALSKALGSLRNSSEQLDADDLPDYHFMMGMPYFDEPVTVASGGKIYEQLKGNDKILYRLRLPNGTILVGHKLSKETNKFLKTLKQTHNNQVLPYEAIVYSSKVNIMNPKYYLALSFPKLSMGQFMKISDIPGKIEEDIEAAYE